MKNIDPSDTPGPVGTEMDLAAMSWLVGSFIGLVLLILLVVILWPRRGSRQMTDQAAQGLQALRHRRVHEGSIIDTRGKSWD